MHPERWGDPAAATDLPDSARGLIELAFGISETSARPATELPAPVLSAELLDSLRAATQGPGRPETSERKLQKALDRAKAEGRDEALREDIAMRKAVDLMVDSAKQITVEQAQARDKLWTPGKEGDEGAKEIWTPNS